MAKLSVGGAHVTVADLPDVNAFSQAPPVQAVAMAPRVERYTTSVRFEDSLKLYSVIMDGG